MIKPSYNTTNLQRFIVAIFILLSSVVAKAESHYLAHISVGAHAGADASMISFTPTVQQSWLVGSTAGVSICYAEERLVGVMAEFNYLQRGWKEKFENSPLSYQRALHYFSIPILTHINFGPKRFKFFFNLGPEFNFLIAQSRSANFDIEHPLQAEGWPEENRMTEQFTLNVKNKFDYGICAGFGCEYYLKPRNSAFFEIRYYFGLGNVFPATTADTFSASRNMSLALTLGYNFRLR